MTIDDDPSKTARYDRAVIAVIQQYGAAMEAFGFARAGSPKGMEATMRLAKDAEREVLYAALGREPTLEELEQVPPLQELPVTEIAIQAIVDPNKPDDEEPTH